MKDRIAPLSSSLSLNNEGIWISSAATPVAYPADGNANCYHLEDASFWFHHRVECILAALRRFPPPGPLLDVGGGNGYVAQRLLAAGFYTALLEPGQVGAANASRVRHIPEVIQAAFEDAAFPPASLSAVGLFDVLEHIPDDVAFLKMICTTLQPGGRLYATAPAHPALWSASDVYAQHFRRYQRCMVTALAGGQFDLCYFTYYFGALLLPIFLFRTLPYRLRPEEQAGLLTGETEHGIKGGFSVRLLSVLLNWELRRIQRGTRLPWGASCLWVLEKTHD